MKFTKKDNVYYVTKTTGVSNNILGVSFSPNKLSNSDIEIIELPLYKKNLNKCISSDQVLKEVLDGLNRINKKFKTNFQLSKIYFLPSERSDGSTYSVLITELIKWYYFDNNFNEVD